jgi:hypothetical protein
MDNTEVILLADAGKHLAIFPFQNGNGTIADSASDKCHITRPEIVSPFFQIESGFHEFKLNDASTFRDFRFDFRLAIHILTFG